MITSADDNAPGRCLLLEVALEAKVLVSLNQHPLVDGTMHRVAGRASFADRFMLKHKRAVLSRMASAAGVKFRGQCGAAAFHDRALMWIVAIATIDFSFQHRMVVREVKLTPLVQMALEAGLG